MWQDTETGEENGKPAKPEVTSDCMTPEEAKDPVKALAVMKDNPRPVQKARGQGERQCRVDRDAMRRPQGHVDRNDRQLHLFGPAALHGHDEIDHHPRRPDRHLQQDGGFKMDRGVQEVICGMARGVGAV
jgi:hypothetical protein